MAKTKTSSVVKNRYNLKAYDRITLTVPKGQKATIQAAADKRGESVNLFMQRAALARMGLDKWPDKPMVGGNDEEV